jgi:hypothetical protein
VNATSQTEYGPPIPLDLEFVSNQSCFNPNHAEHKPQHSPLPAVNMTLVVEAVVDVSKMACWSLLWSAMFYVAAAN